MKHKTGPILMLVGGACLLAAFALFLYNQTEAARADAFCTEALSGVLEQLSGREDAPVLPEEPTPVPEQMPTIMQDGLAYVGVLSLPTLELELPVLSDWNKELLRHSPCRFKGALYTNDLVLMAHNYARHFGRLNRLKPGDPVYFLDASGVRWPFYVAATDVLSAQAVEEMTAGDWPLTLFTCSYDGRTRITVRCERRAAEPEIPSYMK